MGKRLIFLVFGVLLCGEAALWAQNVSVVLADGGLQFSDGTVQTTAAVSGSAPVEKTGQEVCWDTAGDPVDCGMTGQDGEVQAGIAWPEPRFTDNADGTVTDNLTALVWLQDANCFGQQLWADSLDEIVFLNAGLRTCDNYTPGTFTDWRLPNVKELLSLIDYGEASPALPAGHPFLNAQSAAYVTSTTAVTTVGRDRFWAPSLEVGAITALSQKSSNTGFVWAVRDPSPDADSPAMVLDGALQFPDGSQQITAAVGGPAPVEDSGQQTCWDVPGAEIACTGTGQDGELQAGVDWPAPRFSAQGDGTVKDNLTGLVWLQDANCFGEHNWSDALDEIVFLNAGLRTCDNYTPGTFSDWRLPNTRELASLVDYDEREPVLPAGHPFLNVQSDTSGKRYQSSTSWSSIRTFRWIMAMQEGLLTGLSKTSVAFVWAVREGQ